MPNQAKLIKRPSGYWEFFINDQRIPDADFSVARNASTADARSAADTYLQDSDAQSRLSGTYSFTDESTALITLVTSDPTPLDLSGDDNKLIKQTNHKQ